MIKLYIFFTFFELTVKILAIGDLGNNFFILKKFTKKSTIHIINFPWNTASKLTEDSDGVEFFDSLKVSKQVRKINSIKSSYDLCIVISWSGARIAYLAGLNYIIYFVGSALRVPPFIKNPKLDYLQQPLPSLNYFERRFYRDVLDSALACVANAEDLFNILKKYKKTNISQIGIPVDTTVFNENIKPATRKKEKFTFLSPQRIGLYKGIDIIWNALKLCKSDFEVLQVEWFLGQRTDEEREINKRLVMERPSQVKLIPVIKRADLVSNFAFVDAIIGQMKSGLGATIEREAAFCKKPVIQYADPKIKFDIDGKQISSPFLPHSNDPKEVANIIDKVVESKEFREKLANDEYDFVKKIADPEMIASKWDKLFEGLVKQNQSIRKISDIRSTLRLMYYLIINRLYVKKIKKLFSYGF